MSDETLEYPIFSYDAHARKCAEDDFQGQSRRTIRGEPVPQDQIDLIIEKIKVSLNLQNDDALLDIACGNGSLSRYLFDWCGSYIGIDMSDYLISVGQKNFARSPDFLFLHQDALAFLTNEPQPQRFTKMLSYAGFQYFSDRALSEVLSLIRTRFSSIKTIFIGNLPDKKCAQEFYGGRTPSETELNDNRTAIGIWRTSDEFQTLVVKSGWTVEVTRMPKEFYANYYRYDALLTRADETL